MLVSINRLDVRSALALPRFLLLSARSLRAARAAPGNLFAATRAESWRVYWSFTAWQSAEAMTAYARSQPHLQAIREARHLARDLRSAAWESTSLPTWEEAMERGRRAPPYGSAHAG